MTTLAAPTGNEIQDELAASYTRGTDTEITLTDGASFVNSTPLGHVVRINSGSKWCLVIYDNKTDADTLEMGAVDDYALAVNLGGGAAVDEVFPIGSTVELVCAADEIAQVMTPIAAAAAGEVFFRGATTVLDSDTGLLWDETDKRLTLTKDNIAETQGDYGLKLLNETAAIHGTQQYSPPMRWKGAGFLWRIKSINVTPTAGGTGYTRGDILTLTAHSGDATVLVTEVTGGVVDTVELVDGGDSGYTVASGYAVTGGTGGDDCTIEVASINTPASQTLDFRAFVRPAQGVELGGGLDFQSSVNEAAYKTIFSMLANGSMEINFDGPIYPPAIKLVGDGIYAKLFAHTYSNSAWQGTYFEGDRYRGTKASPAAAADGDTVFALYASPYDGVRLVNGALISMVVDGSVSVGVTPMKISFRTMNTSGPITERMTIAPSGAVDVVGAFSKGSGSFKIDHPLAPDDKLLYHGFVEAPRYDLVYRGIALLIDGKATVDIDAESNMTAGTFAALCQNVVVSSLQNQDGFARCKPGDIDGASFVIECEDNTCADRVAWVVIGERKDSHVMSSDMTDIDGHLLVEVDKEEPKSSDITSISDYVAIVSDGSAINDRVEKVDQPRDKKGFRRHGDQLSRNRKEIHESTAKAIGMTGEISVDEFNVLSSIAVRDKLIESVDVPDWATLEQVVNIDRS